MRLRSAIALLAIAALVIVGLAATAQGRDPDPRFEFAFSDFTPQTVRAFPDFPLYSVGEEFGGLPATRINRLLGKPRLSDVAESGIDLPDNRTNYVEFIYGTCDPGGSEGGCAPPLTIQVSPACDRTLQDYFYNTPDGGPSRPYELITVRGVPAAKFDDMLEIYSGRVTIVVFGDTEELRLQAANGLSSANSRAGDVAPGAPLPPPVAGAMEGKLAC